MPANYFVDRQWNCTQCKPFKTTNDGKLNKCKTPKCNEDEFINSAGECISLIDTSAEQCATTQSLYAPDEAMT